MITEEEAIAIAEKKHGAQFKLYGVTRGIPSNFAIYGSFPRNPDDVWCVYCSLRSDKTGVIASGHAVVIAKDTGQVLYDGSACDEG
ncbi:MAG: hypothetical protein WCJ71_09355 [Candidatus Omnitrophota bacterium]